MVSEQLNTLKKQHQEDAMSFQKKSIQMKAEEDERIERENRLHQETLQKLKQMEINRDALQREVQDMHKSEDMLRHQMDVQNTSIEGLKSDLSDKEREAQKREAEMRDEKRSNER